VTDGPATVGDLIARCVARWPQHTATGIAGTPLRATYAELAVAIDALASTLRRLGVRPGATVAVCAHNCPELVVALPAVMAVGAAVAPLDPDLLPAQLAAHVEAAGADVVIASRHLDAPLSAARLRRPVWTLSWPGGSAMPELDASATLPASAVRHDDGAALVLLTSGTTGHPKVVALTHANLCASVANVVGVYDLTEDDATLAVMPLFHGHGLVATLLAPLASGGATWMPARGRFSAHDFWAELRAIDASWVTVVPAMLQILLERDAPAQTPRLRFARTCSAPLAPETFHGFQARFAIPVIPAYGLTEATHHVATNPLPDVGAVDPASVGFPTNVQLRIVGPDGSVLPAGSTGELWLHGPTVIGGYRDNPVADREAFSPHGWFRTGDLARVDAQGRVFLRGRLKELIDRGGEKVFPEDVDAVLLAMPDVADALCFGVPDPVLGEEVEAAVVAGPGRRVEPAEVLAFCAARLRRAERPKRVHVVDHLPRTAKGGADRRALAALFSA
jgi:acyl-CoA synthetase (AMP-forming)/AMP-acid ligase II